MSKEIQDNENTVWTLAEAYAGLKSEDDNEPNEAARIKGTDKVRVVATPSGGAQTVRLELPVDWENNFSDEQLLDEIRKGQQQNQ